MCWDEIIKRNPHSKCPLCRGTPTKSGAPPPVVRGSRHASSSGNINPTTLGF